MAVSSSGAVFAQTDYSIPETDDEHIDVDTLIHPKHFEDLVMTWDEESGVIISENEHADDHEIDDQVWTINNLGAIPSDVEESDLAGEFAEVEESDDIYDARNHDGFQVAFTRADGSCLVVDSDSYRESGDDRDVPGRDRIADVLVEDCESTEKDPVWVVRFRERSDGMDLLVHTTEVFDPSTAAPAQLETEPGADSQVAEESHGKSEDEDDDLEGEVLLLGTERRAAEEGATVDVSNPSGWHNQVWRSMVFTAPEEEEPPAPPRLPVTGSSAVVGVGAGTALVATGVAVLWWRRRQQSASATW